MRRSWFIIISLLLILSTTLVSADLTTNIISYYKFDGDATDSVGSNDGTVNGATNSLSYGKINEGYLFDASTEKIVVPSASELNIVGDISFSFWIYPTQNTNSYIIGKINSGYIAKPYNIYSYNGIFYFYRGDGTTQWTVGSDNAISNNVWTHVVITQSGQSVKFYYNGVQSGATETMPTGTPVGGTENLYLTNHYNNGAAFYGYLDEPAIWSRALTADEVSELYASGSPTEEQQYPFIPPTYYGFNITSRNSSSSINTFSATVSNGSISYDYSTTNGTIQTNSTTAWSSDYYNISITSTGYSDWAIDNYYWSSTEQNNVKSVLTAGTSSSNECTGNFYVSAGCTATLIAGDTFVVSSS